MVLVALPLLALNFLAYYFAQHSSKSRLVASLRTAAPVEGIFSGNSLVEIGANVDAFAKAWYPQRPPATFLNAGVGDSTPVEHCLLLRYALQHHPETKLVIYGFADLQLTEPPDGSWATVVNNRTLSYELEPALAAKLYGASALERLRFEFIRWLPLLGERTILWNRVEHLRRALSSFGLPPEKAGRFGRVADFAGLEKRWTGETLKDCATTVAARAPLTPAIRELIQSARGDGSRPVFIVEMPMPPEHVSTCYNNAGWLAYRAYVRHLVEQEGASYIDAHDWVPDGNEYMDPIHLSEQGSVRFSTMLVEKLKKLGVP